MNEIVEIEKNCSCVNIDLSEIVKIEKINVFDKTNETIEIAKQKMCQHRKKIVTIEYHVIRVA